MTSAADSRSFRVARMRPIGTAEASSPGSPSTNGMTDTPVSKPERPSASLGKMIADARRRAVQSPRACRPARQVWTRSGCRTISIRPRTRTMKFRAMYGIATRIATRIASRNPLMKTNPRSASRPSVSASRWLPRYGCRIGFSTACCAASAADRVMVMTKSVAANPKRARTNIFPVHSGRSASSMAIEPWPAYERPATWA